MMVSKDGVSKDEEDEEGVARGIGEEYEGDGRRKGGCKGKSRMQYFELSRFSTPSLFFFLSSRHLYCASHIPVCPFP